MAEQKLMASVELTIEGGEVKFPNLADVEFRRGVLDAFLGDQAYFRVLTDLKGVTLFGRLPRQEFDDAGIEEDDCFILEWGDDGRLIPLKDRAKHIAQYQLEEIERRINRVIPEEDPGVEY